MMDLGMILFELLSIRLLQHCPRFSCLGFDAYVWLSCSASGARCLLERKPLAEDHVMIPSRVADEISNAMQG